MNHKINWNDLNKIKIANCSPEFIKHEIVKTILVCKILYKYRKYRNKQIVYTEHSLGKRKPDIYHYNARDKSEICYEIQLGVTKKWMSETIKFYEEKNIDWVLVNLKKLSNDIPKLIKQIDDYIV